GSRPCTCFQFPARPSRPAPPGFNICRRVPPIRLGAPEGAALQMSEPWDLSLSAAAAAIAAGRLGPVELLESTLDRIDQIEPRVQAWARIRIEDARREAERLTRLQRSGTILGPLHGIPVGVKDIFNTAGVETACGSRIMAGFVPPADATAVARLRAAGAIILGKTHTTEF